MATVSTQASVAALRRPCSLRTGFLTGSSGKLSRELAAKSLPSSAFRSVKVEAKKGEWLPGLASPAYLDGRLLFHTTSDDGFMLLLM